MPRNHLDEQLDDLDRERNRSRRVPVSEALALSQIHAIPASSVTAAHRDEFTADLYERERAHVSPDLDDDLDSDPSIEWQMRHHP
jgi:hypothetical protein